MDEQILPTWRGGDMKVVALVRNTAPNKLKKMPRNNRVTLSAD